MVFHNFRHCSKMLQKIKYSNLKQLNQIVKEVDQYSKIKIKCNYDLEIKPYDLLDCPSANRLRVTIFHKFDLELVPYDIRDEPDPEILKVRLDSFKDKLEVLDDFEISIKEQMVEITGGSEESDLKCILEVPVKADLNIENLGKTSIEDMYSDNVELLSGSDIKLKNIKSRKINLKSTEGDIFSKGLILAQDIQAVTENDGDINLDKMQGDNIKITTKNGNISTKSSYATNIHFKTENGDLNLKNVHRNCEISSASLGNFTMTAFSGTIKADLMSNYIKLQISELFGQSEINARNKDTVLELNLDDNVLQNAEISIKNATVEASSDIPKINKDFGTKNSENRLVIDTKGTVTIKKLSWADLFLKLK